ncbi:hypothetical protein [Streptomyces roseochromogenus]|uniref:DUF4352 domain-containing protein n=1 Tax=Streptomyces roseochromogenus subsp. oscitans DS 12.976 TaxID=1352936 RepID=V6JDU0_STRRC|nr:hypothetical protein [Streptomyces roseochromogenus]EST18005.1 hypothetical protein M878_45900 [Streptomyces roseochromogenus subsp. oscitans DS 12.976]
MLLRQHAAAAAVLAATALLTGCGHSGGTVGSGQPSRTARPSASAHHAQADALPTGMIRLGEKLPHTDNETWAVATSPLKTVRATTKAKGLPSGWIALATAFTFTNTTDQIQQVPTDLIQAARYGPDGRSAATYTDTGIDGLPLDTLTNSPDPIRVPPGGTYTARLGFAVPEAAKGQPLTLTYTNGQSTRYLEDTIPGATAAPPVASAIHPVSADKKMLAFGDWHAGNETTYLRVSAVKVTGTDASGQRACEVDLTFFNPEEEVSPLSQTPLEASVHVYYGKSLTEADTVKEYTGLSGAFIAPQRTATVTAHFTLPAKVVPGPVTIEIGNSDGLRVTYTGNVGN